MPAAFLDYVRASLAELQNDPDGLEPFLQRFGEQPLYVPTADPGTLPEGKVGIGFTELDALPGVPVIAAALEQAVAQQMFGLGAERIMEVNGVLMLALARNQRFALVIHEGEDSELFEYERLLVMAQGAAVLNGDGEAEHDPAEARKAYPKAFAAWLYAYCRSQPDIGEAWLALVSLGSKGRPSVCVLFDEAAAEQHQERVREQAHLLLPGQLLMEPEQLARGSDDGDDDLLERVRMHQPLYQRTHKHGWWARLQRRRKPAPTVWLHIDLRD